MFGFQLFLLPDSLLKKQHLLSRGHPDTSGPGFVPLEGEWRSKQPRFPWNGKKRYFHLRNVTGFSLPPFPRKPPVLVKPWVPAGTRFGGEAAGSPRAPAGRAANGGAIPPGPATPRTSRCVCQRRMLGKKPVGGQCFFLLSKTLGKKFTPLFGHTAWLSHHPSPAQPRSGSLPGRFQPQPVKRTRPQPSLIAPGVAGSSGEVPFGRAALPEPWDSRRSPCPPLRAAAGIRSVAAHTAEGEEGFGGAQRPLTHVKPWCPPAPGCP